MTDTKIILLGKAGDEHVAVLRMAKKAPSTAEGYGYRYAALTKFLAGHLRREPVTSDFTGDNLLAFFLERSPGWLDGTYEQYRLGYKAIGEWLMRMSYIPWGPNPVDVIPAREKSKSGTTRNRRVTDDEFAKIAETGRKKHPRDYYLAWFMRLSERRISEVTGMKWSDILWDTSDIYFDNTKSRKWGEKMVLNDEIRALLVAWKDYYQKETGVEPKADWYVFPATMTVGQAQRGRPRVRRLNPANRISNPHRDFAAILDASGVAHEKGDNTHVLRKTATTAVHRAAQQAGHASPVRVAQLAAGHANQATTEKSYLDQDEIYEDFKGVRKSMSTISAELAEATDFLSGLVAERKAATSLTSVPTEATPEPEPLAKAVGAGNVVNLFDRARRR
ncbi:tyrosine-type recombinase/integrase [Herbidospora cretacea]|uniref:tyrosine-type recombinase/integrase n=1 Tax=Herbidospora cretacea TaxID=28444 RepID=UPI0007730E82|nr:site-specific integrase [Herbidospora cretacea]